MPNIGPIGLDPQSPVYDNLDKAADAVSQPPEKDPSLERSAAVYKMQDGSYRYSTVNTDGTRDQFAMRVAIPQGAKLAAIVHNHPGTDNDAGVFSPQDLQMADQLKVPSYIRFNSDNSLRSYTPGKTKTTLTGTGLSRKKVAVGDAVQLDNTPQNPSLDAANHRTDRERPIVD